MTKEDKQIIDRAVKEKWRIGDRTLLRRLLEKNLKLYLENVELEQKLEQTEKDLADYQFNYPTIKKLERENAELKKKIGLYQKGMYDEIEKRDKKLANAKEIIRQFLNDYPVITKELLDKLEQFIKEIKENEIKDC
jgi:hypothetical protein